LKQQGARWWRWNFPTAPFFEPLPFLLFQLRALRSSFSAPLPQGMGGPFWHSSKQDRPSVGVPRAAHAAKQGFRKTPPSPCLLCNDAIYQSWRCRWRPRLGLQFIGRRSAFGRRDVFYDLFPPPLFVVFFLPVPPLTLAFQSSAKLKSVCSKNLEASRLLPRRICGFVPPPRFGFFGLIPSQHYGIRVFVFSAGLRKGRSPTRHLLRFPSLPFPIFSFY